MKLWSRLLSMALILCLWIALGGLVLEGWARIRWNHSEKNNPFLRSRQEGTLWPIPRDESDLFSEFLLEEEIREAFRGPGKSSEPLPAPSPEEDMERRYPLFLQLDKEGRSVFASVYALELASVTKNGTIGTGYFSDSSKEDLPLTELIPPGDARQLLEAFDHVQENQKIRFFESLQGSSAGPFDYCLFPDLPAEEPSEEALLWAAWPREQVWNQMPEEGIWEIPFFLGRKHAELNFTPNTFAMAQHFRMNNHGFRDADIILPKADDSYRILCIGASTTEEGPLNHLTYPAILETLLNQHFDGKTIDVINCGLSGMNSAKHKMRMADYLALEPDLILFYNAVNDICHHLLPTWVRESGALVKLLWQSQFVIRYRGNWIVPSESEMVKDIARYNMADFHFIRDYAQKQGVAMAMCSFAAPETGQLSGHERDYYEHITRTDWGGRYVSFSVYLKILGLYNQAIRDFCAESEMLYIPVAENLIGTANLFGDICHLRNPGVEQKARIIFDALLPFLEDKLP